MSNFTNTKTYGTSVYPVHSEQTSGLMRRCEPLLTPELLVSRFLKGISLKFKNGDSFTPDDLKDRINLAMNETELLIGSVIMRESFKQKLPFDASLYKSFVHTNTEHKPIISLEELAIVSSDGHSVFTIPSQWIEPANFSKGIINVIPLLSGFGAQSGSAVGGNVVGGGVIFLSVLGTLGWVPAYWQVKYTAGLSNKEGQIPTVVNELIGTVAAIALLSEMAPLNVWNSQSQSVDGVSQSSSGAGPRIYQLRIEELEKKRDELIKKIKGVFANRFLVGSL